MSMYIVVARVEPGGHSRLGMCLSRCSFLVKLFPQYAQNTIVDVWRVDATPLISPVPHNQARLGVVQTIQENRRPKKSQRTTSGGIECFNNIACASTTETEWQGKVKPGNLPDLEAE